MQTRDVTVSTQHEALLEALVEQAYADAGGAQTPDALSALVGSPALATLADELHPLCNQHPHPIISTELQTLLTDIAHGRTSGGFVEIRRPTLDPPTRFVRYTLPADANQLSLPDEVFYQAIATNVIRYAQRLESPTHIVFAGFDWLLSGNTNYGPFRRALQHARGTNTVYDFIVEDVTDCAEIPPFFTNWYNTGAYVRYYTPNAPPMLGATPANYAEWLANASGTDPRSVIAVNEATGQTTYRLLSTRHTA